MNRLEANREILKKLSEYIETHPDMRFGQVLINTKAVSKIRFVLLGEGDKIEAQGNYLYDEFYVESGAILQRMIGDK